MIGEPIAAVKLRIAPRGSFFSAGRPPRRGSGPLPPTDPHKFLVSANRDSESTSAAMSRSTAGG